MNVARAPRRALLATAALLLLSACEDTERGSVAQPAPVVTLVEPTAAPAASPTTAAPPAVPPRTLASLPPTSAPRPRPTTAAPKPLVRRTTPKPVATTKPPAPKPVAQSTCGAPSNPWGYNFCGRGSTISSPPASFCDWFDCIDSFWENTKGYVMQCDDGMYSHSGGRSGSCSHHGGNNRALYG